MLRRTSTLLLCLGALALFTTVSPTHVDTDGFDLDPTDDLNENALLTLGEGDEFDTGPSSGPFSNKPGWPNPDGLSPVDPPAPTTDAPAPTTATPAATPTTAPTGTGTTTAAAAPTPSMVPAPVNKPGAYPTPTPATTTTSKSTLAPTGQVDTSTSKCPKDSTMVSVEGKDSYCVSTTLGPICSGVDAKGKCPGKQSGLEQGSHCDLVKSGVYGCVPGAGPKRCDLNEADM